MPQPEKYVDDAEELRRAARPALPIVPTENTDHGMERAPGFDARVTRPHKGDVGREGTNEEIFQGFKTREL
jgi:hypothetical protein